MTRRPGGSASDDRGPEVVAQAVQGAYLAQMELNHEGGHGRTRRSSCCWPTAAREASSGSRSWTGSSRCGTTASTGWSPSPDSARAPRPPAWRCANCVPRRCR
ncbi:hypothetical protein NKH77_42215 [Streptomyces sp. M19]